MRPHRWTRIRNKAVGQKSEAEVNVKRSFREVSETAETVKTAETGDAEPAIETEIFEAAAEAEALESEVMTEISGAVQEGTCEEPAPIAEEPQKTVKHKASQRSPVPPVGSRSAKCKTGRTTDESGEE